MDNIEIHIFRFTIAL